ncbi:flavin reductase family protein [Streptomyces albidoflavus]
MNAVAPSAFTRTMARVPTPVTVVTTVDETGRPWGFTASSFSSLSLDPPLVLVCPAKTASCYPAFVSADRFLVNVLSAAQSDIAGRFARSGHDKFGEGDMVPSEEGLPGLAGAVARISCTLREVLDGGDHSILVGQVMSVSVSDLDPLVYHDRRFTRPEPTPSLTTAG